MRTLTAKMTESLQYLARIYNAVYSSEDYLMTVINFETFGPFDWLYIRLKDLYQDNIYSVIFNDNEYLFLVLSINNSKEQHSLH